MACRSIFMVCLSTQFSSFFTLHTYQPAVSLDHICLSLSFYIFITFLSLVLSCRLYFFARTGRDVWNVWFIDERNVHTHCKLYLNCSTKRICFVKDVRVIWSDPPPTPFPPSTCIFCPISLQGVRFVLFNDADTKPPFVFSTGECCPYPRHESMCWSGEISPLILNICSKTGGQIHVSAALATRKELLTLTESETGSRNSCFCWLSTCDSSVWLSVVWSLCRLRYPVSTSV
jgi:hypothetical protein